MNETTPVNLDFEIEEIEHLGKPGCNSSSTSPRCTCPVYVGHDA